MRILVTNDDGIDAEGLGVLARAMTDHGEVIVVAPDREYSGASAALGPLHLLQPLAHRVTMPGIDEAWSVEGPPAMCVMFATLGAFGAVPDLVVAGINPGENTGRAVYHSGTVGAAVTARTRNINGVAISQAVKGAGVEGQGADEMLVGQQWQSAASVVSAVVGELMRALPDPPVVINLNVPNLPLTDITGWHFASLATVPTRALAGAALLPQPGHPNAYHVRMDWGDVVSLPATTDVGVVARGEVAVTLLAPATEDDPACAPSVAPSLDRLLPVNIR